MPWFSFGLDNPGVEQKMQLGRIRKTLPIIAGIDKQGS
jgi:hypothetical protein